MQRELLYSLLGHTGIAFYFASSYCLLLIGSVIVPRYDEQSKVAGFELASDLPADFLSAPERVLAEQLCTVAFHYDRVNKFAERGFANSGMYLRALCHGVRELLASYEAVIVATEREVMAEPTRFPLSRIVLAVRPFMPLLLALLSLVEEVDQPTDRKEGQREGQQDSKASEDADSALERKSGPVGGQLLQILHRRSFTGLRSVQQGLQRLSWHVHGPLLSQLSAFAAHGRLIDAFGEFFVARTPKPNALTIEARSEHDDATGEGHTEFQLRPALLPSYLSVSFAYKVLFCGRGFNLLHNSPLFRLPPPAPARPPQPSAALLARMKTDAIIASASPSPATTPHAAVRHSTSAPTAIAATTTTAAPLVQPPQPASAAVLASSSGQPLHSALRSRRSHSRVPSTSSVHWDMRSTASAPAYVPPAAQTAAAPQTELASPIAALAAAKSPTDGAHTLSQPPLLPPTHPPAHPVPAALLPTASAPAASAATTPSNAPSTLTVNPAAAPLFPSFGPQPSPTFALAVATALPASPASSAAPTPKFAFFSAASGAALPAGLLPMPTATTPTTAAAQPQLGLVAAAVDRPDRMMLGSRASSRRPSAASVVDLDPRAPRAALIAAASAAASKAFIAQSEFGVPSILAELHAHDLDQQQQQPQQQQQQQQAADDPRLELEAASDELSLRLRELRKAPLLDVRALETAVESMHAVVSRQLWQLLVQRADLLGHLRAVRDFYLLGRGEFWQHFIDAARPLFAKPPTARAARDVNSGPLAVALQRCGLESDGDERKAERERLAAMAKRVSFSLAQSTFAYAQFQLPDRQQPAAQPAPFLPVWQHGTRAFGLALVGSAQLVPAQSAQSAAAAVRLVSPSTAAQGQGGAVWCSPAHIVDRGFSSRFSVRFPVVSVGDGAFGREGIAFVLQNDSASAVPVAPAASAGHGCLISGIGNAIVLQVARVRSRMYQDVRLQLAAYALSNTPTAQAADGVQLLGEVVSSPDDREALSLFDGKEHSVRVESVLTSSAASAGSSESLQLTVDGGSKPQLRLSLPLSVRRHVLLAGGSAWVGLAAVPSFAAPAFSPLVLSWEFAESTEVSSNGWRNLRLEYKVEAPLDLLLLPDAFARYNSLFAFLLELKRAQIDLSRAWAACMQQSHPKPTIRTDRKTKDRDSKERDKDKDKDRKEKDKDKSDAGLPQQLPLAAMALRAAMHNYLDSLAFHLQADVIAVQFAQLSSKINESKDFEAIRRAHDDFLAAIATQCFLHDRVLQAAVGDGLELCMSFSRLLARRGTALAPEEWSPIRAEFARNQNLLLTLLARKSTSASSAQLASLLIRLDFNQFWTKPQPQLQAAPSMARSMNRGDREREREKDREREAQAAPPRPAPAQVKPPSHRRSSSTGGRGGLQLSPALAESALRSALGPALHGGRA